VNNIALIAQMTPAASQQEMQVNMSGMYRTVGVTAPGMAERG
jgi:hypothetical protein